MQKYTPVEKKKERKERKTQLSESSGPFLMHERFIYFSFKPLALSQILTDENFLPTPHL